MAISVKHFKNELDCEEPGFEVGVAYHSDFATGASEICNGNGTITNVYGDFDNLGDIVTNVGSVFNGAESDICLNGIDVVFNIDYTASMNNAITGVRYGVVDIANQLAILSNNNYRVGVVLYDEKQSSYSGWQYSDSDYYQNIPAAQKVEITTNGSRTQNVICPAKMSTVGNLTEVQTVMDAIGNSSNTATTMKLGFGVNGPEPGGLATYEIVGNQIAGAWRSDVLKLIINITDNVAGGDDDTANSTDVNYFQNTLTPLLDSNNVQFYQNTSQVTSTTNQNTYDYLALNTTPAGAVYNEVNYGQTDGSGNYIWTASLLTGIADLCEETTVYTCDPAPAGWYAAIPVVEGSTVVNYWNGTAWVDTYTCPEPQYTLHIQYIDQITNGDVEDIQLNHPNYYNTTSWEFIGIPGSQHTATIACVPDAGYDNLSVSVTNVSNNSIITSTSVNSGTDEVTFTVTMPSSDLNFEQFTIGGSASAIIRTMTVTIIPDIFDNSNGQSPTGQVKTAPQFPAAASWTNAALDYGTPARRYEWTGVAGDTFILDVDFAPVPVDYTLDVTGLTNTYEITQGGGGDVGVTGAFNSMVFTPGASPSFSGSFTMPPSDGWVEIRPTGTCTQPVYRYTIKANENIVGGEMAPGDESTDFLGYTGDTFSHAVEVVPSSGYSSTSTTNVQLDSSVESPVGANAGISNLTNNGTGATMDIEIPSGGGTAGVLFNGGAVLNEYDYIVDIADDNLYVTYAQIVFTGVEGSLHSSVAVPTTDNNYTYNRDSLSIMSQSPASSILADWNNQIDSSSLDIDIELDGGMPAGGGTAIIAVNLTATENVYDFNLDVVLSNNTLLGSWANSSITLQGNAGDVFTGSFIYNQDPEYTYTSTGISTSNAQAAGSLQSGDIPSTNYEVTMPVGGGSATLTVLDAAHTQNQYSYNLWYDNSNESGSGTIVLPHPNPQVIVQPAGVTVAWIIDLDPSPSYYDVSAGAFAAIELHGGNINIPAPELSLNTLVTNPDANARIFGYLTMPSGGGTGYVMPKSECSPPDLQYVLNFTNNISNTSLAATTHTFTGPLGSVHQYTLDITPSSGWTHTISNVTYTDNAGGNFEHLVDGDEDVVFSLNGMPAGGSAGNIINIYGTSHPIIAAANIYYTDNSTDGDWNAPSITVNAPVGDSVLVTNTWALAHNNVLFNSINATHDSNGSIVTNEVTTAGEYKFDLIMPSGGVNINVLGDVSTSATTTVDPCLAANCAGGSIWVTRPTNTREPGAGQNPMCNGVINISIPTECAADAGELSFTIDGQPVSAQYVSNFGGWNFTISNICTGTYMVGVYNNITGCDGVYDNVDAQYNATTTTTTQAPTFYYYMGGECDTGGGPYFIYRSTFVANINNVYDTNNLSQPQTQLTDFAAGPSFDYSLTGPGTCGGLPENPE